MAAADFSFIGDNTHRVVGVFLSKISTVIINRLAHLIGMLLIHAKDDGLGKGIGSLQKVSDALSDRLGPGFESDKGTSNNCHQSSGAPNLPANDSALFSFRFYAVHPKDVRDCQLRQLFEVPISLSKSGVSYSSSGIERP
jgi:hypothetical protein